MTPPITVEAFYDKRTSTLTYLVYDPATRDAVVIDPVMDFDPIRLRVYDDSLQKLEARADELGLALHYAIETHAHADHLTGSGVLRARRGTRILVGARIREVQATFGAIYEIPGFVPDGSQFDKLVTDGEEIAAGSLTLRALYTPGHTPACVTWQIGDAIFTGDALFMPDQGTGRCDFPGGSAEQLYASIQRLYALPPETRVFVGHDYQPGGRELRYETTIAAERAGNIQLRADTPRASFVEWRAARDKTLNLPNLIFQSLQVNIRAGALPEPDAAGRRFLKIPLNLFDSPPPGAS